MDDKKSKKLANEFRNEGNEYYKQSKFFKALELYNKSMCFAEIGSLEFSLALANRSAVYFEVKEYKNCLQNIELAIESGYPSDKIKNLIERQGKCEKILETYKPNQDDNPWSFFKLSHPPHKKIPFIAECLKLRDDKKYGRHIVTNKNLKAGDIIAIEEPFFKIINEDARYSRCANCLMSVKMNLFPCKKCTSSMFCSENCYNYEPGFEGFHLSECGILSAFLKLPESELILRLRRIIVESSSIVDDPLNLQTFLNNSNKKTVFDYDFSDPENPLNDQNYLTAHNSLAEGPKAKEMETTLILINDFLRALSETPKRQEAVRNYAIKQLQIMTVNAFKINWHTFEDPLIKIETGSGIFPFASLFNHSCSPNIYRLGVDNKLVFVVTRPIERNQQLFICYSRNFLFYPREIRQNVIELNYHFKCDCEACTWDYPELGSLLSFDRRFVEPEENIKSVTAAKLMFQRNNLYINKHANKWPCYELGSLIHQNFKLLAVISKLAPFYP